jgi:multiple antibiotic resistance protein
MDLNLKDILSAFMVLFAIIDITGSIPVIVDMRQRGRDIKPLRVTVASFLTLVIFLFAGQAILRLFGVNISSFAVAGSLVIFMLAAEMIFDIRIFQDNGPKEASYIVPLVFPLIAGAGSFTALLSLRAEYSILNILIALGLNMIVVFLVLRSTEKIERTLGEGTIYVLRKFFGVILLAIAVKLFTANLDPLLGDLSLVKDAASIRQLLENTRP